MFMQKYYAVMYRNKVCGEPFVFALRKRNRQTIISFECKDDAIRYATYVEAEPRNCLDKPELYHGPLVEQIEQKSLLEFCKQNDYEFTISPKGLLILPPR